MAQKTTHPRVDYVECIQFNDNVLNNLEEFLKLSCSDDSGILSDQLNHVITEYLNDFEYVFTRLLIDGASQIRIAVLLNCKPTFISLYVSNIRELIQLYWKLDILYRNYNLEFWLSTKFSRYEISLLKSIEYRICKRQKSSIIFNMQYTILFDILEKLLRQLQSETSYVFLEYASILTELKNSKFWKNERSINYLCSQDKPNVNAIQKRIYSRLFTPGQS